MKYLLRFLFGGFASCTCIFAQSTLTWDADTGTSGAQDGAGSWNTSNTNWWNGSANTSFAASDNVIFGAATANVAHTVTVDASTSVENLTFANTGGFPRYTVSLGSNTLTVNGQINLNAQANSYYTAISGGTIELRKTGSTQSSPDLFFDPNDGADWGVAISSTLDVGTGSRYFRGAPQRNDVGRYAGDLRFDGAITGSAKLFFSGTATDTNHNMHFVLNAANTSFTGAVELNGNADLALTNASALSSANAVTFNAGTGTRAAMFLFGRNVTIGSLNDTSAGTRWIRNGARNITNGGTNTSPPPGGSALGVNADSTLTIQQSAAGSFGGIISDGPNDNGTGLSASDYRKLAITKNGDATLTLTGTNTYTGGTTINAGRISISNGSALGTGNIAFSAVGTALEVTGTAVTLANNISLPTSGSGNITLTTANNSSTVIDGIISGGGTNTVLFFQGGAISQNTGALTLNGNNTLQGSINVQRGPLILGNANAAGTASIILDSNSPAAGALQLGNFTIANKVQLTSGASVGVATGNSAGISGVISGGATFTKLGAGELTLTENNTYTGATNVSAGTLVIDGSNASTALTTVSSGATLGGSGSLAGGLSIASGGTLAPGSSAGTLTTGNLSLASGSNFDFEFGLTASDLVNINGTLSLGGADFTLTDLGTGLLTLGDSLTLFGYTGTLTGTFSGLADLASFNEAGYDWQIRYADSSAGTLNGGLGTSFVTLTVVPEPAAALLGGLGLLTLLRRRR